MKKIIILGLLIAQGAFPGVGRVGTSKTFDYTSNSGEFGLDLPKTHKIKKQLGMNAFRLEGPSVIEKEKTMLGMISKLKPQKIDVLDLNSEYPELKSKSKDELEKWLLENNWKKGNESSQCKVVYTSKNEKLITALIVSNTGTGYVLIGDNTQDSQKAMKQMIKSTKILKGNCEE